MIYYKIKLTKSHIFSSLYYPHKIYFDWVFQTRPNSCTLNWEVKQKVPVNLAGKDYF